MKTVCLLSLSMLLSAEAVRAEMPRTVSPELMSSWRAHLIDIDQSQTFETLSMADEFTRLPSSAYKTAGVYFITNSKGQVFSGINSGNSFDDPSGKQCIGEGYKLTKCDGTASDFCPYNNEYFKTCCDASYKYSKGSDTQASASIPGGDSSTTTPRLDGTVIDSSIGSSSELVGKAGKSACLYPQTYSDESCGGKYRCECKASSYPFSVCEEPQIKGDKCVDDRGTHYSSCACPVGRETTYGCETYYEAPCDTVCKTNYTDNCRNREGAQTPYGCETYFDDCPSKCEKAYPDNCRNRIDVPAPNGCKSYYSDCQSKCETAYTDNCHNRTGVDSSKFGCEKYFADCPSKCEKAYTDNCSKYTSVVDTCPGGATCTYYADCSSKIQSFSCKVGFEKVDNRCWFPVPILYGDGTTSKEYPLVSGKTPIGIVFDEERSLAMSLTDVKKNGTSGSEKMPWSEKYCSTPHLSQCIFSQDINGALNDAEAATCGVNGKKNTMTILSSTCNGETYAVNAANKYEPSGCTADFCKKTKWFLPSVRDFVNIKKVKNKELFYFIKYLPGGVDLGSAYWTSTEHNAQYVWYYQFWGSNIKGKGSDLKAYVYGDNFVRPAVAYGDSGEDAEETILPILYGDGTISTKLISGKTPIAVVIDEDKHLAVALTDVKEDGSAGTERMDWARKRNGYDIPDLKNCRTDDDWTFLQNFAFCSYEGSGNTDIILRCDECEETPAATACYLYEPVGCTSRLCQKNLWFLPSMRDLYYIHSKRALLKQAFSVLNSNGFNAEPLKEPVTTSDAVYYWSSVEKSKMEAWALLNQDLDDVQLATATYKRGLGSTESDRKTFVRPMLLYP